MSTPQPCVVVRGHLEDPKDAFLVIEKEIYSKVPLQEIPLALIAALFFFLNVHYPQMCSNFHTFFECFFMAKKTPSKKTRLRAAVYTGQNRK